MNDDYYQRLRLLQKGKLKPAQRRNLMWELEGWAAIWQARRELAQEQAAQQAAAQLPLPPAPAGGSLLDDLLADLEPEA